MAGAFTATGSDQSTGALTTEAGLFRAMRNQFIAGRRGPGPTIFHSPSAGYVRNRLPQRGGRP